MSADLWIAFSTAPSMEVAKRLGLAAVEGGHAACANLIPELRSLYRWEGDLQDEAEVLIVFKTTSAAYPALADLVTRLHPYEVPELVAFPVTAALPAYLAWVHQSVAGPPVSTTR